MSNLHSGEAVEKKNTSNAATDADTNATKNRTINPNASARAKAKTTAASTGRKDMTPMLPQKSGKVKLVPALATAAFQKSGFHPARASGKTATPAVYAIARAFLHIPFNAFKTKSPARECCFHNARILTQFPVCAASRHKARTSAKKAPRNMDSEGSESGRGCHFLLPPPYLSRALLKL